VKLILAALAVAALVVPALASAAPSAKPGSPVYWITGREADELLDATPVLYVPGYGHFSYECRGDCEAYRTRDGYGPYKKVGKRTFWRYFICGHSARNMKTDELWSLVIEVERGPYGLRILDVLRGCSSGTYCP
jgi:hypothetical protein